MVLLGADSTDFAIMRWLISTGYFRPVLNEFEFATVIWAEPRKSQFFIHEKLIHSTSPAVIRLLSSNSLTHWANRKVTLNDLIRSPLIISSCFCVQITSLHSLLSVDAMTKALPCTPDLRVAKSLSSPFIVFQWRNYTQKVNKSFANFALFFPIVAHLPALTFLEIGELWQRVKCEIKISKFV